MTSKFGNIVSPTHILGTCITFAAIRWPEFGNRPALGRPFAHIFASSIRTPPVVFTWRSISSAYAGAGLGRRSSIRLRIVRNSSLGTATSANWNVTYRPWLTTSAPIFTNFSRSVVSDQRYGVNTLLYTYKV